jgi:hypothetical protein
MLTTEACHREKLLAKKQQGHAGYGNQGAGDNLPAEALFEDEVADWQHEDGRQSHQCTGYADIGMLDCQQRGRDSDNRS